MTGPQWERLKILFHGALAQSSDRQYWLVEHAEGDEMLEREAAALIEAHETAGGFLDPPLEIEAEEVAAALQIERRVSNPLDVLEREIASSVRPHGAARESTDTKRRPFDQLMMAIVRRVRQLLG